MNALLCKKMHPLRRSINVLQIVFSDVLGRKETTEDGEKIKKHKYRHTDNSQLMLTELAPHQLPLRGDIVLLFVK